MPAKTHPVKPRRDKRHPAAPAPHLPTGPADDELVAVGRRRLDELVSLVIDQAEQLDRRREEFAALADRVAYAEAAIHHLLDRLGIDPHLLPDPIGPHCYVTNPRTRPVLAQADRG